ncbi:MAG: hypothetical protein FGM54_12400, partial [Chitinophagaceae bacterium]|nr:hypothetical protein [Chitinophagaceae bacterium]
MRAGLMEKKMNRMTVISYMAVVVITILYAITLRKYGLEIQNDSCSYIRGALNINKGLGFTGGGRYINHFPAGMSILYAFISAACHMTIYKTALICHLCWIAGLGFIFIQLMRILHIADALWPLGLILFLFSPPLWTISSKFLTELPSAFLLGLSTLFLFQFINEKGPRYRL